MIIIYEIIKVQIIINISYEITKVQTIIKHETLTYYISSEKITYSISISSSKRFTISSMPTSSNVSNASPPISHILVSPCAYYGFFLERSRRLLCIKTRSSARLGVILFFFIECTKEYVLRFLLAHDEEDCCARSFKAKFCRICAFAP